MVVYGHLVFQDKSLPLDTKTTYVGRAPSCALVITHPSISKEHGIIEFSENGVAILRDLNSLNGIYVNENRVSKGGQCYLYNNSVITFGKDPTQYIFHFEGESATKTNPPLKSTLPYQARPITREAPKLQEIDTKINLVDQKYDQLDLIPRSKSRDMGSPPHALFNPAEPTNDDNVNRRMPLPPIAGRAQTPRTQVPNAWEQRKQQSEPVQLQQQSGQKQQLVQERVTSPRQEFGVEKKQNLAHHNEVLELNEKVLQKDDIIYKKDNELNLHKNEIESLKDECGRLKSKLHAVELYASELQRKNDLLTHEISERNAIIQELQSVDLGMKAQYNMNESKSLRQILLTKDEELSSLKRQLKAVLQAQTDPSVNSSHYEGFLEQQAKELAATKRQLQEFESRSDECKRKWNQLIQENISKEEKIKGLSFQLNRQIESYQALYSETDRKIGALNVKYISLVNEDRDSVERQAAEYLVDQMKELQEEREVIALENERLHLQIQELIEETGRLNEELQELHQFFQQDRPGVNEYNMPNFGKMKARIDELEDLHYETKQTQSVRKVTELNETISELERRLAFQEKNNQELKDRLADIKANQGSIQEQSAIDFFSKLLEDKEQQIVHLKTQNDLLLSKEKQYQIEIEHLRENIKQSTLQFENYKTRQNRLENVLTSKGATGSQPLSADPKSSHRHGLISDVRFASDIPFESFNY